MGKSRKVTVSGSSNGSGQEIQMSRPALTPEARENQMIALAVDAAERQLRDGTASAQVIVHYLKLGSTRAKLEKEILAKQKDLIEAKTESIQTSKDVERLYTDAIEAMRRYSGHGGEEPEVMDE